MKSFRQKKNLDTNMDLHKGMKNTRYGDFKDKYILIFKSFKNN